MGLNVSRFVDLPKKTQTTVANQSNHDVDYYKLAYMIQCAKYQFKFTAYHSHIYKGVITQIFDFVVGGYDNNWIWAPSLSGMGISMLKVRRSRDRLIFDIGIPILVSRHIYIETNPCPMFLSSDKNTQNNNNKYEQKTITKKPAVKHRSFPM